MKRIVLYLSLLLTTTACSIEANVSELIPDQISKLLSKTAGAEFVSSSQQQQTTVDGYKVQVSTGNYVKELKSTTPSGYTVFTSIQGDIIADQVIQ